MLDAQEIQDIRELMEFEAQRKSPPEGFPKFPDIPAGRYNDEEFFQLEKEHYWSKLWTFAGHMDEIPEIGSYKLWEMSGEPIVIVRGKDNKARAFFNTCRHRGASLVVEEYGQGAGGLTCGYHGWTYDYEGNLINLRDKRDFVDLDMSCRGLYSIKTEQYGKLIFVNFDEDAIPLSEYLGPFTKQWEEFAFGETRLVKRYVWDLACNWKIAMEANMEVYHVKSIHPVTVDGQLDYRGNVNVLFPRGHSRMVAPNRPEWMAAMPPKPDHIPEIETVGEIARTCVQSYHLEPNIVMPVSATLFPILQFWPDGRGNTKFEIWWIGADWGEGEAPPEWEEAIRAFDDVLVEDTHFGDWIQKSVDSSAFKGAPLCYQEARIYHAHQSMDKTIGANRVPEHLRIEPVLTEDWVYPKSEVERLRQYEATKAAAE